MMRRSTIALSGGMKLFGDFHIKEHLLQNYEGWRILDNPQYEDKFTFYSKDPYGFCRYHDPIIDDPRLTHKQRVCRLYRWAVLEMRSFWTFGNAYRFNIGVKVIRNRFEKYRYVTDPAACDMMIRETQKYLRDQAFWHYYKWNPQERTQNATQASGIHHPDNSLVYDHWVSNEVFWYDDAKIHRFSSHHPMYSGAGEMAERYGDDETLSPTIRKYFLVTYFLAVGLFFLSMEGFLYCYFHSVGDEDPYFLEYNKQFDYETQASVAASERSRRMRSDGNFTQLDWESLAGFAVANAKGFITRDGTYVSE